MNTDWMSSYRAAEESARANMEHLASRSHRVADLVSSGYRFWLDGVAAHIQETRQLLENLSRSRSLGEILEAQRSWLETTASRQNDALRAAMDLSSQIIKEITALPEQDNRQADRAQADRAAAEPVVAPVPVTVSPVTATATPAPTPRVAPAARSKAAPVKATNGAAVVAAAVEPPPANN